MKKIAFLFPGQGSQSVGMLQGFAADARFTDLVGSMAATADAALGDALSETIAHGPAESLNLTVNTQPAMLLADVVALACWKAVGGAGASITAGHSLGEYAALVCSGVLAFEDAVRLVRIRATAMQNAVPVGQGGMAAILGLDDAAVVNACQQASTDGEIAEAVNFNAPSQVVIAGSAQGVNKACEYAKAAGAKRALPLPVSAPFHSSLMKPAAEVLKQAFEQVAFNAPSIPCVNNIDVATPSDAIAIKDALYRQAFGPVRWVQTIEYMNAQGVTDYVEMGPGKVLAGLVKRMTQAQVHNVYDAASLDAALAALV